MNRFYRELSTPGESKALALHRAQQELLDDSKYTGSLLLVSLCTGR